MLLIAAVTLLVLGLVLLLTRRHLHDDTVSNEILYEDISQQRYTSNVLTSERYGLRGKPDYIMMTKDGVVPVELKSTGRPPLGRRVHKSHMVQILAYCAIVGESLGERIPYGLVIYRDQVPRRVIPTPQRMAWMEKMATALRAGRRTGQMHRDHGHVERCLNCGVRDDCTEALNAGEGWQRRRMAQRTEGRRRKPAGPRSKSANKRRG